MRLIPLAVAVLWWAGYSSARSQEHAQNAAQPTAKSATQASASQQPLQQASSDTVDKPVSLADLARAARSKKQIDAKPAAKSSKILDDDNMPRGVYACQAGRSRASGTEFVSGGKSFPRVSRQSRSARLLGLVVRPLPQRLA